MKSLFSKNDTDELISRINSLKADSKPLWGEMNVSQMLAHCTVLLKATVGEIVVKGNFFMQLIGRIFKNKIIYKSEIKKNTPTSKEFVVNDERNFEEEKNLLISYLKKFPGQSKEIITKNPHPFFGKLSPEDYDYLQYKHVDHHLRQFGV